MGPFARVIYWAAEVIHAFKRRFMGGGKAADSHNAEARLDLVAFVSGDCPLVPVVIKIGACDAGIELDVFAEVQSVCDMFCLG